MKAVFQTVFATAITLGLAVAQKACAVKHVIDGSREAGRDATFDYIVVGGGTGGLAMAYRLAEDGTKTVAVIEAGGFYQDTGNLSVVPAYAEGAYTSISPDDRFNNPETTWGFLTTPQAWTGGAVFHYARGKTLGGTSALNAQNYQRATVGTMDVWADLVGDSSYEFDNFFQFFQKSVNLTEPNDALRADNATVPPTVSPAELGGPVSISHPHWATPIASWAQLAFRELGIMDAPSQIDGAIIGSQYNPLTQRLDQTRESSQTSFLDAGLNSGRNNLKVYTHTMGMKILFNRNKAATGVTAKTNSGKKTFTIRAKEEVIVSAGAFQSPQLLMVSGVGPAKTLSQFKIPIVADRPGVGQRMVDHTVCNVVQEVNVKTYTRLQDPAVAAAAVEEYNANRTGILTNELSDYLAWENLPEQYRTSFTSQTQEDLAAYPADWPDLEYIVASGPFGAPEFSTPENPIDVMYFTPVLNKPISEGNVSISSASMADMPLINPNLLSTETDEQVLVAALRRARDFFNTTAMAGVLLGEELFPGEENLAFDASDDEVLEYLKNFNSGFTWHAGCSNRMGRTDDPMAVLDSQARVIGVKKLRVVDVSSFPLLPPGHPMSLIFALAEKISEDIIKEW